jgi:hypothetical protein
LAARVDEARVRVGALGYSKEFGELETVVKKRSGVVVTMPAATARQLFEDPKSLYANYERLVGSRARRPANCEDDRRRSAVAALLFGSYADDIIYGVLSLTNEGLPTYGDIHCRLRSVTIDRRTSFLETNSFRFVQDHRLAPGEALPLGRAACWEDRHCLVLAKLADRLSAAQTESDWQALLIHSDGLNRENDDFVEAHIYEGFDRHAVESVVAVSGRKLRKEQALDRDLAVFAFNRLGRKTG